MKCKRCFKEIIDADEMEFHSYFNVCLSCDHVQLDSDEQICDHYAPLEGEVDYGDYLPTDQW